MDGYLNIPRGLWQALDNGEPMHGHHGDYSVLMTREDDANTEKLL